MEENPIIKTFGWREDFPTGCLALSLSEALKLQYGDPQENYSVHGFHDLLSAYSNVSPREFFSLANTLSQELGCEDVSRDVIMLENACLFDASEMTALDIVLQKSRTRPYPSGEWYYLDTDEKVVVHFVDNNGHYAEVFFESGTCGSAIHLIKEGGSAFNVVAVFVKNLQPYRVECNDNKSYLRQYLPRYTVELLGKRSYRRPNARKGGQNLTKRPSGPDQGDTL